MLEQPCAKATIHNWQLQTVVDPINDHVDFVIIEALSDLRDETKWWLFLLGGRVAQLEYITSGGARGAGWDLQRIECIKMNVPYVWPLLIALVTCFQVSFGAIK